MTKHNEGERVLPLLDYIEMLHIRRFFLVYTHPTHRVHFAQELIFQNKQLKYVTPLDFVHNSDSLKCYNFSQEDQFFML